MPDDALKTSPDAWTSSSVLIWNVRRGTAASRCVARSGARASERNMDGTIKYSVQERRVAAKSKSALVLSGFCRLSSKKKQKSAKKSRNPSIPFEKSKAMNNILRRHLCVSVPTRAFSGRSGKPRVAIAGATGAVGHDIYMCLKQVSPDLEFFFFFFFLSCVFVFLVRSVRSLARLTVALTVCVFIYVHVYVGVLRWRLCACHSAIFLARA